VEAHALLEKLPVLKEVVEDQEYVNEKPHHHLLLHEEQRPQEDHKICGGFTQKIHQESKLDQYLYW